MTGILYRSQCVKTMHDYPLSCRNQRNSNHLGFALLTLSWDKNWDSHSLVNGYLSFYPRIALVAPSPGYLCTPVCARLCVIFITYYTTGMSGTHYVGAIFSAVLSEACYLICDDLTHFNSSPHPPHPLADLNRISEKWFHAAIWRYKAKMN